MTEMELLARAIRWHKTNPTPHELEVFHVLRGQIEAWEDADEDDDPIVALAWYCGYLAGQKDAKGE